MYTVLCELFSVIIKAGSHAPQIVRKSSGLTEKCGHTDDSTTKIKCGCGQVKKFPTFCGSADPQFRIFPYRVNGPLNYANVQYKLTYVTLTT